MSRSVRICVIGEWLHGNLDEGIHNLAQNLLDQWAKAHSVWTIKIGTDFPVNRLFLSLHLRKMLHDIHPDFIFYISPSCTKIMALFRAKMLKVYSPRSRVLVVSVQPVNYNSTEGRLLSLLAPDGIFVQSSRGKELLRGIRCPVHFLPSGVDLERFVPVQANQKLDLRKRYGVNEKAVVVLHVGHIRPGRNVQLISNISQRSEVQVLLVGSTSTPSDETLTCQLTQLGVQVIREFIPHIEEVYQLADIYFFPVTSEYDAIGVPLSVLEAMACNLPVITTRFGGLPLMFQEGRGLFYFDDEEVLPDLLRQAKNLHQCSTRQMIEPFAWCSVAHKLLEMAQMEDVPIWN